MWSRAPTQWIEDAEPRRMTMFDGAPTTDGGSALSTNGVLHEELVRRLSG